MTVQDIARLIPTIQAAHLAKANVEMVKKKPSTKHLVGMGMKNIVGVNIIKAESDLISGL